MKFKSKTFVNLNKFKAFADNQSGTKLNALLIDTSGEFLSNEFIMFCDENGIHKQLTTPYTPKQKAFLSGRIGQWWKWLDAYSKHRVNQTIFTGKQVQPQLII